MTRERQNQLIEQLSQICKELDWVIGIPLDPNDTTSGVPGLFIGNEDFVNFIIQMVYESQADMVETYTMANGELEEMDDEEPVNLPVGNPKKNTVH